MKISVIVPTYNQNPAFLRAALLSLRHQTLKPEIVVVDDGSFPAQIDVFRDVFGSTTVCGDEDKDQLVEYEKEVNATYTWKENGGVGSALNEGLRHCTGDWIRWLPSDDLYSRNEIEMCKVFLSARSNPKSLFVSYSGWAEGIPGQSACYPAIHFPDKDKFYSTLCGHCFVNSATVAWPRQMFEEIGEWRTGLKHTQDYEFLLRCADSYRFIPRDTCLVRRRIHLKQMSMMNEEEAKLKEDELKSIRSVHSPIGATQ